MHPFRGVVCPLAQQKSEVAQIRLFCPFVGKEHNQVRTVHPLQILFKLVGKNCTSYLIRLTPPSAHPYWSILEQMGFWISRFLQRCRFCFLLPAIFPRMSRYSGTITSAPFFQAYSAIAPAIFFASSLFRRLV